MDHCVNAAGTPRPAYEAEEAVSGRLDGISAAPRETWHLGSTDLVRLTLGRLHRLSAHAPTPAPTSYSAPALAAPAPVRPH